MRLIDELAAEHALIDRVLGSLRAFVEARARGEGDPADGPHYVKFFRVYANHWHHAREEDILFRALAEKAELPAHRGPIAALTAQHGHMAQLLAELEPLLAAEAPDSRPLRELAVAFSHALWRHIDAEDSVLLPESEARLKRNFVLELDSPAPGAEALEARAAGETLLARHPPLADREVLRGDGCVHCPSFTVTCDGLEQEWWNEWEWDEFEDRMTNG